MKEIILLKIIIVLFGFIMNNPNIPQETKDQALQLITDNAAMLKDEQVASTPADVASTPEITQTTTGTTMEPIIQSKNIDMSTQFIGGDVRTEGNSIIFIKNDSDDFHYKIEAEKGIVPDGNDINIASYKEPVKIMLYNGTEGTLEIYSSKNDRMLNDKTYKFKVKDGVIELN